MTSLPPRAAASAQGMQPRTRLFVLIGLLLVSLFFWNSIALYPVKLFVVLLHELSHAAAALLTGGSVVEIQIDSRIGGLALTQGGWSWLVVSSGYTGSMLLGGAILLLSLRSRAVPVVAVATGVIVLLVTVFFVRNTFGLIFGVLFGSALLAAARWLPAVWLALLVQYLGAMSCLYALVDVKEDVLTLQDRVTDASILAGMTGIPAIVWGVLWSALSLLVFILIMRAALRQANATESHSIKGKSIPS
ncbi:MAG: M50 family metallopeptidase [Bacteroidetes bacterium]|nr:M50 family metallopeptidase [Bacteroidota bacterium]